MNLLETERYINFNIIIIIIITILLFQFTVGKPENRSHLVNKVTFYTLLNRGAKLGRLSASLQLGCKLMQLQRKKIYL